MAKTIEDQCAHPLCTCPVEAGEEYCGQACSDADLVGIAPTSCACAHPQCAGAKAA